MMGVPIVNNTAFSETMRKKKSNSIAYHAVREAVAMGEILMAYIPTDDNVADLMTKALPGGEMRDHVGQGLL
jgi:hypothetical protein